MHLGLLQLNNARTKVRLKIARVIMGTPKIIKFYLLDRAIIDNFQISKRLHQYGTNEN